MSLMLALFGHATMSDLSRECEPKRTSADADLARTLAGSLQRGVQLRRDAQKAAALRRLRATVNE
jgi:hypothetical protein